MKAESLEHAFQNMCDYERKVNQRSIDEDNMFMLDEIWTRYFS